MYFLPIFFEFFENKRLFARCEAFVRRRVGSCAPQTMVYCVCLHARYGAWHEKSAGKTRMQCGFLSFCRGSLRLEAKSAGK
jgi:hypothetical protein